MPIRIAIVDDVAELRQEIATLLKTDSDMELAGEFAAPESALKQLPVMKPDVVLMDIRLPAMSGVECASRVKTILPATQVMMLTVFDDYELIFQSLQAGATGYLLKKSIPTKLLDSIRELHEGGSPMSSSIARKVVQAFARMSAPPGAVEELSHREQQILGALSHGKLYKEIAEQFDLSYHTVRAHLRKIYKKLQVCSRTQAIQKNQHPRNQPPT